MKELYPEMSVVANAPIDDSRQSAWLREALRVKDSELLLAEGGDADAIEVAKAVAEGAYTVSLMVSHL